MREERSNYPGDKGESMKILVLLLAAGSGARLLSEVLKPILG
jgi:hypothetical protein